jgi:hypothetical protein
MPVAHACNPNYLGGCNQEDGNSRTALTTVNESQSQQQRQEA